VLQAAQNPSHAFPNAACGGYKQLNELSCLNGNSINPWILKARGCEMHYDKKSLRYDTGGIFCITDMRRDSGIP
jgi:hypothetical protein